MNRNIVSKDIAKKLYQIDFDELCNNYYENDGPDVPNEIVVGGIKNKKFVPHIYAAPTPQMVADWLRENHDLHICIDVNGNKQSNWEYNIIKIETAMFIVAGTRNSYNEAFMAAIESAITILEKRLNSLT